MYENNILFFYFLFGYFEIFFFLLFFKFHLFIEEWKILFTKQRDVEGRKTPLHWSLKHVTVQLLPAIHLVIQAGHNVTQDHPSY